MGYDSDHPRSEGEVGKCGVAIASLADMETLFAGIPLDQVSTSMTINGPAAILFCFYVAAAEKQGVSMRNCAARSRTTFSRSTWPSMPGSIRSSPRSRSSSTCSSGARSTPALEYDLDLGYHIRESRCDRGTGARVHARQWLYLRRAGRRSRPRHRQLRRPAFLLWDISQRLLSKRSRNCVPPAASGRGTCASATRPSSRGRG